MDALAPASCLRRASRDPRGQIMTSKAGVPAALLGDSVSPELSAYFALNHLKLLFREGWLRHGVPRDRTESVADHTFGVAMLALTVGWNHFPAIDRGKAILMALLHDCGEVYAGDITPADDVPSHEKHRTERAAMARIFGGLPNGHELLLVWDEFERGESAEAQLVHQLDRLELGLQALIYARQGLLEPEEFLANACASLQASELRSLFLEAVGEGAALTEVPIVSGL
jgi:putative hydrolases of HD superfamily